jgi:subtilisin family serine protease
MGNATFNITASVTCVGGPCGNVSAYLDPLLEGAGKNPKTALEAAANGPIEIIVTLKEQSKEKSRQSGYSIQSAVLSALSQEDFELGQSYLSVNGFSGKATQAGISALLADPNVESIRASRTFRTMLDVSVPLVNATALWNTSINGQNINGTGRTVCIIDTGVNYAHPDFGSCTLDQIGNSTCAKIAGGYDFVNGDNDSMDSDDGHGGTAALGHGTHVSGIVGSIDGTYAGMAPGARIAMAKVCDSNNTCSEANMISGIEWCINNSALYNISAISISLGSSDCLTGSCDGKACDNDDSPAMVAILRSAYNANIPVMAASGNENLGSSSNVSGISSPACISTVISVGATDDSDVLASLGNRDRTLDMLAPGVNIEATDYAGTHTLKSGTSMATPHVSGAAALLNQFFRQKYSRAPTSFETDAILKTGGKSVTDTAGRINLTYPRLNALGSSLDKGIISTTTGAKPFYTKSSNPSNSTCYRNMAQSLICNTTWLVNATGDSGVYSFFVIYSANATDQGGAQMEFGRFYSGTYNISIDNIGPNVSLVSPNSGNFSSSANLTLTFNATDDFDINISCTLYVDAASRGTFAMQNGTSNDYSSNYSNGFHRWNVSCADDALTSVSSETRNFTVDLINPMITIVSPSTAYYGTGSVLINISANDTNKDKTWFFTNGTANITYTVPVTLNFSDGMYNMTAYVNDSAGRTNTTNRTFIVDTTAPTISFADPTPNSSAYATKSYVAINASASDANFANITIRIYNSTGGLRNSSFSNSSSTLFANFTGLSNGVYYFNATVYDRVGLYNFTETRNVTVDFTGPAISFASPSDNTSSLSRDYISANVSAPGADLANMTIYLYNATSLLNFTNSTSSPLFANFSGLGNGIYYVNATAFDNAGNLNKTETRTITLDTAAPGVALGAPANGSFTSLASVNTSFTAVDALAANTSCRLYVDGTIRANITAANNTLMSQLYNYTAGTHNWSVNCTDFANNTGASDVWNFTVDLTNPTITIDSPWLSYYYNTSSIWINISANDTNLDTVWFYTNDTNVTYTPPGIPFVLGFDDGVYNMTAWVNDSAGRTVSSGRTFTVDTAAPTVSIQSPANTTYNTSNLGLDFTASDTYLESCWYSIGGGNATPISGCANGSDIVGLANGSQCISVFANDSAGNVNNDTVCLTLELAPESNPPVYSGLVPSENYNYTYRPDVIYYLYANWTDDTGIGAVLIENNFSGTDANDTFTGQNGSRFEYYIGVYLAAGQYSYRWLANDTFGNLNDSMPYRNITVLQADPNATISAVSWAGTWPYQSTVNCTGESQVNMTLYRNNTLVGSGFGFAQDIRNLSAGVYNYTCNTSGNGNYTSDSASATLTISRMNATVNISVSPSLTVNWSTATNVSCSASSLLNISLYRNGTLIGTGMGHVENVANLSAGTYNYSCNISANENHTANSTLRTLTVNRATPNLTLLLDGSAANIDIDPYDTLDMDANVTAPAGGYIELYVDSALFNRGNALLSNSTSWSSSGTHTIKVVFNITANYSASSLSRTVTVSSSGGGGGGGGGGSGLPYMKITNYTTCNRDNTSNVRVVVVSAANSTPLNIVTVFTDYNNMYTAYTTGYTFRDLADGTYTIHAEKNGYRDTTLTVSLNCTPRTVAPQNQTGGGTPTQNKTSNGTITQNKTAGGSVSVAYSSNGTDRTVNVTLAGIGPNYATYKVGNLTSAIKVSVGQNLTVDVDSDGTPDIYIKLNSVTANSASAIMGAIHALPPGQGEGGCVLDNEVCAADSECCSGKCVNEVCTSGISLDGIINPIKSLVAEMGDKLPQVLAAMLVPLALMAIAIAAGYFLFLRKGIGKKRN